LTVTNGSAGAAAAAHAADIIVSLGDVRIIDDASLEAFRARYAGTTEQTVPMVVRRGANTATLQLPLRLLPRVRTRVVPIDNASPKAVRIRSAILRGTVDATR
jgi:S1-C subfamily serine protease